MLVRFCLFQTAAVSGAVAVELHARCFGGGNFGTLGGHGSSRKDTRQSGVGLFSDFERLWVHWSSIGVFVLHVFTVSFNDYLV